MKTCTKCGEEKPATAEFWYRRLDGWAYVCKSCAAAYAATRRATHPEENRSRCATYATTHRAEAAAASRAYYATHREEMITYAAEYRVNNSETIKVARAQRYAANPEPVKARATEYYITHLDACRAARAIWRTNHPGCTNKWRAENPEQWSAIAHRARAKRLNAPGTHTAADIRNLHETQNGECFWCGTTLDDGYHVDHLYPLSKGGSNGPENLALACPSCNLHKSATDPDLFLERITVDAA